MSRDLFETLPMTPSLFSSAPLTQIAGPWSPDPHAVEVQKDIVAALERVLVLVPTSPPHVVRLLIGNFPHKLRDR